MEMHGTFDGTFNGMPDEAFDRAFGEAFDGPLDRTFAATFDGTFDGTFDRTRRLVSSADITALPARRTHELFVGLAFAIRRPRRALSLGIGAGLAMAAAVLALEFHEGNIILTLAQHRPPVVVIVTLIANIL